MHTGVGSSQKRQTAAALFLRWLEFPNPLLEAWFLSRLAGSQGWPRS